MKSNMPSLSLPLRMTLGIIASFALPLSYGASETTTETTTSGGSTVSPSLFFREKLLKMLIVDDETDDRDVDASLVEIPLEFFSMHFQQCFMGVMPNGHRKEFAVVQWCDPQQCESCPTTTVVALESYLKHTVQYFADKGDRLCELCYEQCGASTTGNNNNHFVDCDVCYDDCQKMENMEENGYVDATQFLECQMIYDPEDDEAGALYAGPICASGGTAIHIGVFTDEDCQWPLAHMRVDDYLMNDDGYQMKLSHALLKTTYRDMCLPCADDEKRLALCHDVYTDACDSARSNC